jgi:uncharacterized protein YegL
MRHLPIFLLLDVSESMTGENHINMESGISKIVKTLRSDPYALETAYLSIIAFAGKVKILNLLTEVPNFVPKKLPIGGGTSLGLALTQLMDEIDRNVITSSHDRKCDWKPIVFLFADGSPTDNVDSSIMRWNQSYRAKANLVVVSIGQDADLEVLRKLTEDVLVLSNTSDDSFARFINWVSRSIQSQSRSISAGSDDKICLDKIDKNLLLEVKDKQELGLARYDNRFAIFAGKCARKKAPYLLNYQRTELATYGAVDSTPGNSSISYGLEVVLPLDNTFFDLTSEETLASTISSSSLNDVPSCPHCEALSALAVCSCGKIHCIGENDIEVYPWCGNTGLYAVSHLDIQRGLG